MAADEAMENLFEETEMANEETIRGRVSAVLIRQPTGFTVFAVELAGTEKKSLFDVDVKVVATLDAPPVTGIDIEAYGEWSRHPRFGEQFKASLVTSVIPKDVAAIAAFLESCVKGVGKKGAAKVVAHFGQDTGYVLEHEPERLHEVKGLKKKVIEGIIDSFRTQAVTRDLVLFLHPYGIGPKLAAKVFKSLGNDALLRVTADPYELATVPGISFTTADAMALSRGLAKDSPSRVTTGLLHLLKHAHSSGHCAKPCDDLVKEAVGLLGLPPETVSVHLEAACDANLLVSELAPEGRMISLPMVISTEMKVVKAIKRLCEGEAPWEDSFDIDQEIAATQNRTGLNLSESQQRGIREVLKNKVSIITGGPGVGKTTILRVILDILKTAGLQVAMCAPTGRAAKRMVESTGGDASTIHRLLEWNPEYGAFTRNANEPLDADVVVVDESSMVDIYIAADLLDAISTGAGVIFIGDVDQLPSVGAGKVFEDLIKFGGVHTVRLTEIFRQAKGSRIVTTAHSVLAGEIPSLRNDGANNDFFVMQQKNPEDAQRLIVDLVAHRLPSHYGFDPFKDIHVLAPMHRGATGTKELNRAIQEKLHPQERLFLERNFIRFGLGDKVIQTKNDYELGVYNGDIGVIRKVDTTQGKLTVVYDGVGDVEYDKDKAEALQLAYCTSVHKAQGSEFPCVVLALMQEHYVMLDKKLLYTAITRAKQLLVMVTSPQALAIAVKTSKNQSRVTLLDWRLGKELETDAGNSSIASTVKLAL